MYHACFLAIGQAGRQGRHFGSQPVIVSYSQQLVPGNSQFRASLQHTYDLNMQRSVGIVQKSRYHGASAAPQSSPSSVHTKRQSCQIGWRGEKGSAGFMRPSSSGYSQTAVAVHRDIASSRSLHKRPESIDCVHSTQVSAINTGSMQSQTTTTTAASGRTMMATVLLQDVPPKVHTCICSPCSSSYITYYPTCPLARHHTVTLSILPVPLQHLPPPSVHPVTDATSVYS